MINHILKKSMLAEQSPVNLCDTLRAVAQQYREDAAVLQSAWQDSKAGNVWIKAANSIENAARQIEKEWGASQ